MTWRPAILITDFDGDDHAGNPRKEEAQWQIYEIAHPAPAGFGLASLVFAVSTVLWLSLAAWLGAAPSAVVQGRNRDTAWYSIIDDSGRQQQSLSQWRRTRAFFFRWPSPQGPTSMISVKRTDSGHGDFADLVKLLDAELAIRDGADHSFYSQFNTIDRIKYVVLAYDNDAPVGCGAIKEYGPGTMEVKRMYVRPDWRQMGVATKVLAELETWAKELSARKCILETGKKQPEAIGLYRRQGYTVIPNYGQYAGVNNSVCFGKNI